VKVAEAGVAGTEIRKATIATTNESLRSSFRELADMFDLLRGDQPFEKLAFII
jgi:hypothetical protein